jgi:putative ABC transport system permease protein
MVCLGFQYALRERGRFALTVAGVASAVVLTVFLVGIYRSATRGSLSYIEHTDADIWVGRKGSWNLMRTSGLLTGSVQETVRNVPGVAAAEAILAGLLPADLAGKPRTLLVIGLEAHASRAIPRFIEAGDPCPRTGTIVIDRAFARRAGLGLGDEIKLAGHRLCISGISTQTNLLVTQYAFVLADDLRAVMGLADHASFLLLRTEAGREEEVLRWLGDRHPEVEAFAASVFLANNRREVASGFLPVLLAVACLGMAVGVTVVALTTYAAVLEKRSEFALLAAIGASDRTRFLVVLQLALSAALGGAVAGLVLLASLEPLLPMLVPEVEFHLDPLLIAAAVAGVTITAGVGALVPARLAARIPPMEAFKR